jgi:hypothetical protein
MIGGLESGRDGKIGRKRWWEERKRRCAPSMA